MWRNKIQKFSEKKKITEDFYHHFKGKFLESLNANKVTLAIVASLENPNVSQKIDESEIL